MSHPEEAKAQEVYKRIKRMTGWRDEKIRFWFEQANPLLGMVTPAWLIMHKRTKKLDQMLDAAEQNNALYRAQYGSQSNQGERG